MAFSSLAFLAFFPAVVLLYWLLPNRARPAWLLVTSLYFLWCWGVPSFVTLAAITVFTWAAGRGIAAAKHPSAKKVWLVLGLLASAGYLFARKGIGLTQADFSLPAAVGLAFYALQAASYLADLYQGKTLAEPHLWRYALYLSFFPRIVSGPIGRPQEFFPQIDAPRHFDAARTQSGLLCMLWGYFLKLAVADPLNTMVDTAFQAPNEFSGTVLFAAVVMFGIALYADFAGYSRIAIGAAQVLGYSLSPNFLRPYFSQSIREFWRRWHISLSEWLRDYIYIPLGGSRRGRLRKYGNLAITFLVSGLWHGTGWQYLFWGALHAFYQIAGDVTAPARAGICRRLPAQGKSPAAVWLRRLFVFFLADFAWLFFRSASLAQGFSIVSSILTRWCTSDLFNGALLSLGLNGIQFTAVLFSCLLLFLSSLAAEHGAGLDTRAAHLPAAVRTGLCLTLTVCVLLFASWQIGGDAAGFYYAKF
jgi:D-alanyl-lipoteichoic acid acyltransferase DltB (MBOAT superfamily)